MAKKPIILSPEDYAAAIDDNPSQEDLDRGTPKRPIYLTSLSFESRGNPMMAFNHVHLVGENREPSTCVKYRWGEPGKCPVSTNPIPDPGDTNAVGEWLDD